jgi:hypothetical protein
MRKSDTKGVFVEVARQGSQARVMVDAVDEAGQFINAAQTKLTVIGPDLQNTTLAMRQTAPGRYEADLSTTKSGAYQLEIDQSRQGVNTFHQSRGLVVGYPDELRLGPTNDDLLQQVSRVSAGKFNPSMEEIFQPGERQSRAVTPLWPYLLMASACLLILDVALRRVDFSLWF